MQVLISKPVVNSKYILITALAVFLSWILHELAHWTAGELLGYRMGMTVNKSFPVSGFFYHDWHYQLISAAGPLFTLLQAIIIFILLKKTNRPLFYPFLFTCFYMRLFAAVISFRNPNDEARISKAIGWGTFTLPFLITVLLFVLVYIISKKYRYPLTFNALTLGLTILFSSLIILADMYWKLRLI